MNRTEFESKFKSNIERANIIGNYPYVVVILDDDTYIHADEYTINNGDFVTFSYNNQRIAGTWLKNVINVYNLGDWRWIKRRVNKNGIS